MVTTSMTGSYSYLNYLNEINKPYLKDIIRCYIKAGGISTRIGRPHTEGSQLRRQKREIDHLPPVNWTGLNGTLATPGLQPFADYSEGAYYIRDNQEWDMALRNDKNYVVGEPSKKLIQAYLMARSFSLDNYSINNYPAYGPIADKNGVTGIKYRLALPTATGSGCNPACWFQSVSDLSFAGVSSSTGLKLTYEFQRMLSHMGNPKGTGVIMLGSPQLLWMIDYIIKNQGQAGGFETTKDAFDRTVRKFMDMEIAECGLLPPADGGLQTAPIISDAQDANGWVSGDPLFNATGNVYTTAFFIQTIGEEKFGFWQVEEPWMVVERISGTYNYIALHQQSWGIWQPNTRSIGGLYGIKTNGPTQD